MSVVEQQTKPGTLPAPTETLVAAGLESTINGFEGLESHVISGEAQEIDLNLLPELEEGTGLLAVIDLGGAPVKLYGTHDESGKLDDRMIMLTSPDFRSDEFEASFKNGNAIKANFLPIPAGRPATVIGRGSRGAHRLKIDNQPLVSREHMSIALTKDGKLRLEDLGSMNGTGIITGIEKVEDEKQHTKLSKHLGSTALGEVEAPAFRPEFTINGVKFGVDGVIPSDRRGNVFILDSIDQTGQSRHFGIYNSISEGGWRVAPAMEPDGRLVKGGELEPAFQYTQESQLHPEMAVELQKVMVRAGDLPVKTWDDLRVTQELADAAAEDFGKLRKVGDLSEDEAVLDSVCEFDAGELSREDLKLHFEVQESEIDNALDEYISQLNTALEKSDVVPDFNRPERVEHDNHSLLGPIQREVYAKHDIEWYMAHDSQGRVWIDRIRFAKSDSTPYGTDEILPYSGLLTSKPVEYKSQANGLPEGMRVDIKGTKYEDISPFLDTLLPIKRYRSQRGISR